MKFPLKNKGSGPHKLCTSLSIDTSRESAIRDLIYGLFFWALGMVGVRGGGSIGTLSSRPPFQDLEFDPLTKALPPQHLGGTTLSKIC